eukprot:647062-Hanusia_phi.AAC.1
MMASLSQQAGPAAGGKNETQKSRSPRVGLECPRPGPLSAAGAWSPRVGQCPRPGPAQHWEVAESDTAQGGARQTVAEDMAQGGAQGQVRTGKFRSFGR